MDRQLISLKFAMLRHTSAGTRPTGWVIGAALVAITWAAPLFASDDARPSVLMLLLAGWGAGAAVGPILMSGSGVLRPDYFTLLPLERRAIARGLLVSTFVSIAAGYVLLAYLSIAVPAFVLSPPTILVALIAAPLTWVLTIACSRLVYALLGAAMRSKLGIEIAGIQFGLMFAVMFTGWMIVQVTITSIPGFLADGAPAGPFTVVLEALPTSWGILAIERAADADWVGTLLLLVALAALAAVVVVATVALLRPRTEPASTRGRRRARSVGWVAGGGWLPKNQLGAVIAKELRQWRRDAWRSLEIRSGVWTGLTIGLFAWLSGMYSVISPFAGLIVAFMLGLAACNLYGQDGSAVWQNVVGQNATSVRSDVRGRQWATIIIFLPQAVLVSALFLVLTQHFWAIPALLAALPALFGSASGTAVLVSAIGVSPGVDPRRRVGPNDANGEMNLQVWITMLVTIIGCLPTGVAILWSALGTFPWFATALVGIANGVLVGWLFGRIAISWLGDRMPDVYSRIRYGRVFRTGKNSGALAWVERTTLANEQKLQEQRQKEREQQRAKASAS